MKRHVPDLGDLLGPDVPAEERERLARAHELLLRAGPPPELPASLLRPPEPGVRALRPLPTPRRRRRAPLAFAAAAVVLFATGAGYLIGGLHTHAFRPAAVEELHGTAAAPLARATISRGSRDRAGNWPLRLSVRGLPPLPPGDSYEMYLTKNGHPVASCGTFTVGAGTTVVRLNVPYQLNEYTGWVVTRDHANQPTGPPVLTT